MASIKIFYFIFFSFWACNPEVVVTTAEDNLNGRIYTGADQMGAYLPLLEAKKVALVVNQTSVIEGTHLVDSLVSLGVNISKIFAPEHGFRGKADAGEKVNNSIDQKTQLPIISLYGKNKKPKPEQLENIDIIIFDIQDVGVRFYTYISTLHYVMEAAAESKIPLILLDRPNPNIHYVDGPVLKDEFKSFVGMHNVPVVYGMTIGEYGKMINGEQWINGECDLTIIPCQNYYRKTKYFLPIKPSPNLPNTISIRHYPSLCFFEGTSLSLGRGTEFPFQVIGHPKLNYNFEFKPVSKEGAKYPKHENKLCKGLDLRQVAPPADELNLSYLIDLYRTSKELNFDFFNDDNFFNLLAGTDELKYMIQNGFSENDIKLSWKKDLDEFKQIRSKYLIYRT